MKAALLIVASFVAVVGAGETNLLRNTSFRADGSGAISGWRIEALQQTVVPGVGPYGTDVLRLPLNGGRAYVVQSGISLKAGTSVVFGAWVRTKGLTEKSAHLLVVSDEWKNRHHVDLPSDTQGAWQWIEECAVLKPAGPYVFVLHVERRTEGGIVGVPSEAWLDL